MIIYKHSLKLCACSSYFKNRSGIETSTVWLYFFGIVAGLIRGSVAVGRVISDTELKAVTIVQKDRSVLQPFIQKFRKFAQL